MFDIPFIQNVSLHNIEQGNHHDAGDTGVLIQIVDPGMQFPKPRRRFSEVHQFEFFDVEEPTDVIVLGVGSMELCVISDSDAQRLVDVLQTALDRRQSVIVHCVAGLCRSGAVAEVGTMMGFADTETFRQPNVLVKSKMIQALGWGYTDS